MRHALLLAGGQGKRFWPRSRRKFPKQFMEFEAGRSLLRITAERLTPVVPFERQWVITNRAYVRLVRAALPEIPADQVLGEPVGLNTGPAVGLGAVLMRERDPDAQMIVQAADHWIRDVPRFQELLRAAFERAEKSGNACLIGFDPVRASSEYGYIALGKRLRGARGVKLHAVEGFKEKPGSALARRFFRGGEHLWNGCMFFWSAETILAGIEEHRPELATGLERFATAIRGGASQPRALGQLYRSSEPISIEHGVVEHLTGTTAIRGDCGWEDVGTWTSMARLLPEDESGNAVQGEHVGIDTERTLVLSDRGVVATIGLKDFIVVKSGDAVLVLPRKREGEIRDLLAKMEGESRLGKYL